MGFRRALSRLLWGRRWLPFRHARLLFKGLRPPPDHPFEVDFFGMRYRGNLNSLIDSRVYYHGAFEKPLLFFLRDVLRECGDGATVFLDVGANVGQHSLFCCRHARVVHAFEPFAAVRETFEGHLARNGIENVRVHPVGLGRERATLPFYAPGSDNLGVGSFEKSTVAKGNAYAGDLEVVTGDEYLTAEGVDRIDLIKIDVEGFEKHVLRGLKNTLEATRPVLVVEVSCYGGGHSFATEQELRDAFPAGYTLFNFETRTPDGRKNRRAESRARRTGRYALVPFRFHAGEQDDVVACPDHLLDRLPRRLA